jgi:hypothetical protein
MVESTTKNSIKKDDFMTIIKKESNLKVLFIKKIINRFTDFKNNEYIIRIYMKKFIAFMAILALVSCGKSGDKGEFRSPEEVAP